VIIFVAVVLVIVDVQPVDLAACGALTGYTHKGTSRG
jgi:hypothetical protein